MTDWDDLRFILALWREGSLSAAARRLRVNHATVYRRLQRCEARLGARLFDRIDGRYHATQAGEELVAAARQVEDAVIGAERRVGGHDVALAGTVRITTTDSLVNTILAPHLRTFLERHPAVNVEVAVTNSFLDLSRRETDVALRPTRAPSATMVGRRVSAIAWAIYGAEDYLSIHGRPISIADLAAHVTIQGDDTLAAVPAVRWLADQTKGGRVAARCNTFTTMAGLVRAGVGLAVLPCSTGDLEPGLIRLLPPITEIEGELWLLTHPDVRRVARVRALLDFLAPAIRAQRSLLEGRLAHPSPMSPASPSGLTKGANTDSVRDSQ